MSRQSTSSYCGLEPAERVPAEVRTTLVGSLRAKSTDSDPITPGAFGDSSQVGLRPVGRSLRSLIESSVVTLGPRLNDAAREPRRLPGLSRRPGCVAASPGSVCGLTYVSSAGITLYREGRVRTIRIILLNSSSLSNVGETNTNLAHDSPCSSMLPAPRSEGAACVEMSPDCSPGHSGNSDRAR